MSIVRNRVLVALLAAALCLLTVGGAMFTAVMLDYANGYQHADNSALDLESSAGRMMSLDWDFVRGPYSPELAATYQDAETRVLANLHTLERSTYERHDTAPVIRQVQDFIATSDNERDLAQRGYDEATMAAARHNDDYFGTLSWSMGSLVRELRSNADTATKRVRIGIIDGGLMYVLATALGVIWAARRRRERDRLETETTTRARYEALVENGADLVVLTDAHGHTTYISPTRERLLGYENSDESGDFLDAIVHRDDARLLGPLLEAAKSNGQAGPIDYRLRHADGGWRVMELTIKDLSHVPAVGSFVWSSRDVTERRGLERDLERAAFQDTLTGLANRALFLDRLEQAVARARRHDGQITVLLADLDGFKSVNDGLGHSLGDTVLVEVARRLESCVRPGDTVARLGGDEFTVLLEDGSDADACRGIAERLLAALEKPIVVGDSQVRLGASIGIATTSGTSGSATEVLRNADTAMYAAKAAGRGQVSQFEPAMHERAHAYLETVNDLDHALANLELEVYYQPTVGLEGGKIVGTEALVRWHHPERGLVSPAWFIPIAERTGHVVPIGRWVLAQACQQAVKWIEAYPSKPARSMSVNLSARQVADPGIVDDVREVLEQTGLEPSLLILEITESVVMDDIDASRKKLEELKALGVRLAIDDFGTGYSSLSYLRQLPVDILKIDRAFTEAADSPGSDGQALIQAIIDLGRSLHLTTVAEGIEQKPQAEQLRTLGCDIGQGFWFARPMPARELETLLTGGNTRLAPVA